MTATQKNPGARTDPRRIERFVVLVGSGILSNDEAARAAMINERVAERIIGQPDIQRRVDEARTSQAARAIPDEARKAIDELLSATTKDGDEDWAARARGAEMLMKYQEAFEEHEVRDAESALPEGVYEVFPRVPR